jgi:RNA polymerase sigma-70 factor (ECF subfamily)
MLISDGDSSARLLAYSGSGSLAGWLRITALRVGLSLRRKDWREVPVEDVFVADVDPSRSPDEALARREHAEVLAAALREAIAAQPSRTRALLRYYYADRVGVEELGRIYHVNASTISRWLAAAREAILDGTRKRVAQALRVAPADADDLFGLTHSLEVSLHGLLATVPKHD